MEQQSSVLEMAQGAIMEQVDSEVVNIMDNIQDLNTDPSKKRTLTLTVDFIPYADRKQIVIKAVAKSKLMPCNPVQTTLYCGVDGKTGEVSAIELTPNIPGQTNINGDEQEQPKTLKMVVGGNN